MNAEEVPARYNFDRRDRTLLTAATILLRKLTAKMLRPAELVSVAKLQHALSRLPRGTLGLDVPISVTGPRRKFGEIETWHWWEVALEDGRLSISSGGHFYQPSTGGDSFTTMNWAAAPGQPAQFDDYRENLLMVPDVYSFPDAVEGMDFAAETYTVEITDPDNPLLEGDTDEETFAAEVGFVPLGEEADEIEGGEGGPQPWSVIPLDAAERRLAASIDPAEVDGNGPQYAYDVDTCDFCRCSLTIRGLFVDGRLRGEAIWGNMCAKCFDSKGAGIGWGSGQLYARQRNGDWRMVAGFPPKESA